VRVGGHPALSLHASNEPDNSCNDFDHDDSTINIVVAIIILCRNVRDYYYILTVSHYTSSCSSNYQEQEGRASAAGKMSLMQYSVSVLSSGLSRRLSEP